MTALLALLTKEIGAPMARALFDKLRQQTSRGKIARVETLIKSGASVLEALRDVLGKSEFAAMVKAVAPAESGWTYEAGTKAYIRLPVDRRDDQKAATTLRDELNLNLDRVAAEDAEPQQANRSVRGVMAVWLNRVEQRFGGSHPSVCAHLAAVRKRLRTSEGALSKLLRVSGVASAMAGLVCLGKAAMLLFSFGVGIFALIKAFLFGVPFVAIAALAIAGVIFIFVGGGIFKRRSAERMIYDAVDSGYAVLEALRMPRRA